MMMRSPLYQTNTLSRIFIMLAHWNNTPHVDMSPHSDTLSCSEPTSLCFFSLMLPAQRRSSKYQFDSIWFDPVGARSHDLPHLMLHIDIADIIYQHKPQQLTICLVLKEIDIWYLVRDNVFCFKFPITQQIYMG